MMTGEVLLITGGNGSGKSTLLKAIFGILAPWDRNTEILFRPIPDQAPFVTRPYCLNLPNGLGYLPQRHSVFDDLTIEDNFRLAGHALPTRTVFATRREEVLACLPSLRSLLGRKPQTMSGGERQMVGLGMLLLHRPKLLMLDEPTAGLDSTHLAVVVNQLRMLNVERGISLIIVEHRADAFAPFAHRTLAMRLGKIGLPVNSTDPNPSTESNRPECL